MEKKPISHILITIMQINHINEFNFNLTVKSHFDHRSKLLQWSSCPYTIYHSHSQISFNPEDNTQICVSGNGVFKIFRFAGETLKQSSTFKTDTHHFLCHTWMSTEQVIAGTDAGHLMMFESGRLRWEMNVTPVKKVYRWVEWSADDISTVHTCGVHTLQEKTVIYLMFS